MRTHIVTVVDLPKNNAALIRKPVQRGDRVVFQNETAELETIADEVQTEPGLMKGWAMLTWKQKEVNNG